MRAIRQPEEVDCDSGVKVFVVDSITAATPAVVGHVVVTGSHGGANMCLYAAAAGARGAIFNDAGIGKDAAGIAGLRVAERFGVAAAAVSQRSAAIGLADDTYAAGLVSEVNRWAAEAGVAAGMQAREAAILIARWTPDRRPPSPTSPAGEPPEVVSAGPPPIGIFDSVTQVQEAHRGWLIITASHTGLIDGAAVKVPVAGAFFNDAGGGKDESGIGRLTELDRHGVPAGAVSHWSARIGDARDCYRNGVLSIVNRSAAERGLRPGQRLRRAVVDLQRRLASEQARSAEG